MKLYFKGHDYKYAAEQMLLTMFPQERPEYPQGQPEGDRMELSLGSGEKYTTAVCSLYREGRLFRGRAAAVILPELEELEADRIRQRLIKNAMYRAALKSGVKKPAWGALTGVRPGKLLAGKLSPNAEAHCDHHGHGEGHHDCKGHGEGHHGCGGHGEGHHGCGH